MINNASSNLFNNESMIQAKVVLITGAAKRVGAQIARFLHEHRMRIAIHHRNSADAARLLCAQLNQNKENSAIELQADLNDLSSLPALIQQVIHIWGRLDVLINNASSFEATKLGETRELDWQNMINPNLRAPFFLSQAAIPYLKQQKGCIINMVDIRAQHPLKDYAVYCVAKAGLVMLTKVLAKELAPTIRVNGIAPGIVLWPDTPIDEKMQQQIIARTPMGCVGTPQDIAKTVLFLIRDAHYTTGQIINVDGGRSLNY
jgi:pteridine reductase